MSKHPTSSDGPNRFFVARTIRNPECRSPSKASTTSTRCSSIRGPAIAPSLVTCPTSTTAMCRSFASRTSAPVTSRTWVTPPGAPSTSGCAIVCTESITRNDGSTASTWPTTVDRSVSAARYNSSTNASVRPARSRTWAADSSPDTYSVRWPRRADCAATSSNSVDLPTPGSPASRITAPGTTPPPSTRSSSPIPVGRDSASIADTLAIGVAGDDTGPAVIRAALGAPTSATVPQAWHSPQRPIHRGVVQPHSEHANAGFARAEFFPRPTAPVMLPAAFAMTNNLGEAADKSRQPVHRLSRSSSAAAPAGGGASRRWGSDQGRE